jgi:hypothetical protein
MDLGRYLQEIEALVQHLSTHAGLLGDMDLYVIEQWYTDDIPLEAALAGTRKGAQRLQRLKRPPKGLPLKRVRPDVKREVTRFVSSTDGAEAAPAPVVSEPGEPPGDETWRSVVRTLAEEAPASVGDTLRALADDESLGEERAFVRFLAVSGEYYQHKLDSLEPRQRQSLMAELATSARAALAPMSPSARDELLQELARRRLASDDPVLEPRRFWQD